MDSRDCGASEQKEGKYRRKKERAIAKGDNNVKGVYWNFNFLADEQAGLNLTLSKTPKFKIHTCT